MKYLVIRYNDNGRACAWGLADKRESAIDRAKEELIKWIGKNPLCRFDYFNTKQFKFNGNDYIKLTD